MGEGLTEEIERIYMKKIDADRECDNSHMPRRSLIDFIVEYYMERTGSMSQSQKMVCGILRCLLRAERMSPVYVPAKVQLFARVLEFCELHQALPLPILNAMLLAKLHAQPHMSAQSSPTDTPKEQARTMQEVELQLSVAQAHDAALKALPADITKNALKELFKALARCAQLDERRMSQEFVVMAHLIHHKLQRESAPAFRTLISRAEQREPISTDDFRDALHEMKLSVIEDHFWVPLIAGSSQNGSVSHEMMLENFGGGSRQGLPSANVTESAFLSAVTAAAEVDHADRAMPLKILWERRHEDVTSERLSFTDIKSLLCSADPGLTPPQLHAIYMNAVEFSRDCTRAESDVFPVIGTVLEELGCYGADTVMWEHLRQAVLRLQIFSKETQHVKFAVDFTHHHVDVDPGPRSHKRAQNAGRAAGDRGGGGRSAAGNNQKGKNKR